MKCQDFHSFVQNVPCCQIINIALFDKCRFTNLVCNALPIWAPCNSDSIYIYIMVVMESIHKYTESLFSLKPLGTGSWNFAYNKDRHCPNESDPFANKAARWTVLKCPRSTLMRSFPGIDDKTRLLSSGNSDWIFSMITIATIRK